MSRYIVQATYVTRLEMVKNLSTDDAPYRSVVVVFNVEERSNRIPNEVNFRRPYRPNHRDKYLFQASRNLSGS